MFLICMENLLFILFIKQMNKQMFGVLTELLNKSFVASIRKTQVKLQPFTS
jgi:hypothetical protein